MCFIKYNQRGVLSYHIRQLHCRARGARAHNLLVAPTVPHEHICTWKRGFLFVNRYIGV